MAFKITTKELKGTGYVLLGFFMFFLMRPLQDWIGGNPATLTIIGVIGIIATLYFFNFNEKRA
jgi:hypothetical protein